MIKHLGWNLVGGIVQLVWVKISMKIIKVGHTNFIVKVQFNMSPRPWSFS